jgi:hypothetical protein
MEICGTLTSLGSPLAGGVAGKGCVAKDPGEIPSGKLPRLAVLLSDMLRCTAVGGEPSLEVMLANSALPELCLYNNAASRTRCVPSAWPDPDLLRKGPKRNFVLLSLSLLDEDPPTDASRLLRDGLLCLSTPVSLHDGICWRADL